LIWNFAFCQLAFCFVDQMYRTKAKFPTCEWETFALYVFLSLCLLWLPYMLLLYHCMRGFCRIGLHLLCIWVCVCFADLQIVRLIET
jgi:hypothetical protein